MAYTLFAPDGSSLFVADVFGVTRFALGKAVKVKHQAKVSAPTGVVSIDARQGALLVWGRTHTGAYGNPGATIVGLPALGLRTKLSRGAHPQQWVTLGDEDRLVAVEVDALDVSSVDGDSSRRERRVDLSTAARTLDARALGPQADDAARWLPEAFDLTTTPDGRFLARCHDRFYAGSLGADAAHDGVWWKLPLAVHPGAEVGLALVGDTAWVLVRDRSTDTVRCVSITRAGEVAVRDVVSLCVPAVDGETLLAQPANGTVEAHDLASGAVTRYDVSAWDAHPAPEPEASVYKGLSYTVPARHPGLVAVRGAQRWFVPWHRECAVDLVKGAAHARGLDAGPAALRRLVLERYGVIDEALRGLHMGLMLSAFERHPKDARVSLSSLRSVTPAGLVGRVAEGLSQDLHNRYELRTHGWHWGSSGTEGGWAQDDGPTTLATVRALLSWMRAQDLVPGDVAHAIGDAYDRGMGIPSEPYAKAIPLEGDGERLFLRAHLETLAAQGWPEGGIPDAWSVEPLTLDLVQRALAGRARATRYYAHPASRMASKMLARHLGADALPLLLAQLEWNATHEGAYDEVRAYGEATTFVVHHHPHLRDTALASLDRCLERYEGDPRASRRYDFDLTRERVARCAKHFWSNA